MALSYKTRRRLSLVVLLVWLPIYIVAVISVLDWLGRPPVWVEFLVYIGLGFLWVLPFRRVFLGVGRADPDAENPPDR